MSIQAFRCSAGLLTILGPLSLAHLRIVRDRCTPKSCVATKTLAMQKFPEGTGGIALDALARTHLWNSGLDYGHGTGHGVGHF
ncbi:MAG: hypothetical protein Ct9H300mP11_18180 [Chloroflexota bacterium]|nr:MAG: hypothetical protein Ct9H300mP11_18180 [Chloroflexota bacterium]